MSSRFGMITLGIVGQEHRLELRIPASAAIMGQDAIWSRPGRTEYLLQVVREEQEDPEQLDVANSMASIGPAQFCL